MMKINRLFFLYFINFVCFQLNSQVSIGTKSPSPNSIFELESFNKGFLLPRMSSFVRNSINVMNPKDKGLQVFDTTTNSIWYWNGNQWVNLHSPSMIGSLSIILNGNSIERAALNGDVHSLQNSNIVNINNNAVTTSKIAPGNANSILKTNNIGAVLWAIDHSKITNTKAGNKIATYFDKDSIETSINESITSLSQNLTNSKITYISESNTQHIVNVVSEQSDNSIKIGSDGGALLQLKIIDAYFNGAAQNITSTATTLNLNTIRYSSSNVFNLNNNQIMISEGGIYSIEYSVGSIITSMDEVSSRFWIEKNNIEIPFSNIFTHSYDNSNFCSSRKIVVNLQNGDIIRIRMQRFNSINLITIPSCSSLIIQKLN